MNDRVIRFLIRTFSRYRWKSLIEESNAEIHLVIIYIYIYTSTSYHNYYTRAEKKKVKKDSYVYTQI